MSAGETVVLAAIHSWAKERAPVLERVVPQGAREGAPVLLLGRRLDGAAVARFGAFSTWALSLSDTAAVAVVPAGACGERVSVERGGLRSNTVSIDGPDHPRILRADPEEGATGVWLDPVLVLRTSHPVDRTTLTADSVVLLGARCVGCRVMFSPDRRALVCRPAERLLPRHAYTLRAIGLRDVSGRPFTPFTVSFETGTEVFADG